MYDWLDDIEEKALASKVEVTFSSWVNSLFQDSVIVGSGGLDRFSICIFRYMVDGLVSVLMSSRNCFQLPLLLLRDNLLA